MDSHFQHLTATELRPIIILEMRKFTWALELGSTLSDLKEIREHIKELVDILTIKEKEENLNVEIIPHLNIIHSHPGGDEI
jgi:hypothetical protein